MWRACLLVALSFFTVELTGMGVCLLLGFGSLCFFLMGFANVTDFFIGNLSVFGGYVLVAHLSKS
jgi:hypothetical protein